MIDSINTFAITEELIISKIHQIKGQAVMLDYDLSELYGIETKVLNQVVRRNAKRFPDDFIFRLTQREFKYLPAAPLGQGGVRKLPLAFTEQGIALLSGALNNETVIEINIRILRLYTRTRVPVLMFKDLSLRVDRMEKKFTSQKLLPQGQRDRIGFRRQGEKD